MQYGPARFSDMAEVAQLRRGVSGRGWRSGIARSFPKAGILHPGTDCLLLAGVEADGLSVKGWVARLRAGDKSGSC